ncbi:MAG TPA: TlpA disulfide reductase family protein [Parafilimonas sp.]|nr:TlpA disulfide reductase family protein [Parafilimonas sp.]
MKHCYCIFLLTIATFCNRIALAQNNSRSPQLTIGDNAPELRIGQWLKDGGFKPFEKGKVYLIDLWATWCVPCIVGMPHLSELQKKYKANGLEVIGITSEDKYGNTLESVKNFILKKDSLMNYNVAWVAPSMKDTEEGIWLHPWMQQSGFGNLPTSFLIDRNGKIVYMGDPSTIDKTLDDVMEGNYDVTRLREEYISGIDAEKTLLKFNHALKTKVFDSAINYGLQLLTNFLYVRPNTYLVMGWQVAHIQGEVDSQLLQIGYNAIIRGIQQTNFNSPAFYDVLAAIYAARKDYPLAIIIEKLAVALSEGEMKKNQTKNLEKYLALEMEKQKR